MAQAPDWKQALETGMQFTELRRSQARKIAQDLVSRGQVARERLEATVEELLDMSRRRSEDLARMVRSEVQRQLHVVGLATKDDVDRLERKIDRLSASASAAKKATAKKATAKKAAPKKAPAKKAPAQKAPAQKAARSAKSAG